MDRPLSMTELQTIRAALEAADNYAAMVELTSSDGLPEDLAGLVELVHRALAVVDRRIHALNRRAIERVAGAESAHEADALAEAVHRAPRLDPDDLHAFAAGLAKAVGEPVPPLRVPRATLERAGVRVYDPNTFTCVCGHSRSGHGPSPLVPDPYGGPCANNQCYCTTFLSLADAKRASGCTCNPVHTGKPWQAWEHAPGCRLHVEPKP
jgi:hypothetical protein